MLFFSSKIKNCSFLWILLGFFSAVEGKESTFDELRFSLISVMGSDQYKKFNANKNKFELLRNQLREKGKNVRINNKSESGDHLLLFVIEHLSNTLKEGILPDLIRWLSTLAKEEGDELNLNAAQHEFDVMYWVTEAHNPISLLQELCSINKENKNKLDVNRLDPHFYSPIERILSRKDLIVRQKIACIRILHEIAKDSKQKIDETRREKVAKIVHKDEKIDEDQRKRLIDTVYPDEEDEVNVNNRVNEVNKLKEEVANLEKEADQLNSRNAVLTTEKRENKEKIEELEKLHKEMEDTQKNLTDQLKAKEREDRTLRSSLDGTNHKLTQQLKDHQKVVAELQNVKAENQSNREEEKKKKIIIGGTVLILFVISHLFANRRSLKKWLKNSSAKE